MLLKSPYGARTEARIRRHFDQLVERISAHEIMALAQGDGFVEKKTEPASIDKLLAISTFDPPAPTTATETAVASDLSQTTHDVDIPLNRKVLSYIELFQGNLREFISEGLQRGAKYLPMIQEEFREQGLPLDLAYIPLIESAFKNTARSRVKAQGMWQFMSYTGREHGLTLNWYVDERSDPEKATKAAAQYLKTLGKMFDNDWHLAMASYNGGPGRVQRAMRRSGKNDFWALTATSRYLPRETREYVPMILAAIVIAKNPAQYGFTVEPQMPLRVRKGAGERSDRPAPRRRVDERADRRDRSAQSGASALDDAGALAELRNQSAGGHRRCVPRAPRRDAGREPERVPVAFGEARRNAAVDFAEAEGAAGRSRRGELADAALARAAGPAAHHPAGADDAARRAPGEPGARSRCWPNRGPSVVQKPAMLARRAAAEPVEPQRIVHRVKRGDTLFSIAKLYNTTVASLKSWNARTIRGNRINIGDRLTIFATRAAN